MIGSVGNIDLEDELFAVPQSRFYRGRNRLLGSPVLVRRYEPDEGDPSHSREAFFRAQRHAASLVHPGIFRPTDILEEQGSLWTVHEFHLNRPSDVLIRKRGPVPLADAAGVAAQIGDALAYMHRRGFVHGKVSPSDVVVGLDGRAFLLSLTKSAEIAAGHWPLAPDLLALGPFSAPEEFTGQPPTPSTDAHGLAGTVFYWLTGAYPRGGASAEEARRRAEEGAPVPDLRDLVPDVPALLADALGAALAADPSRRRGSAASLASLFDETHRHLVAEVPSGFESGVKLDLFGQPLAVRLLGRHGAGAFGVVFRARDESRRSLLAVKALKPAHRANVEARERFLREAEAARGIQHRNVVRIRGVGESGGTPFVVMDFVEGADLATLLLREGVFGPRRAATVALGIARGLAAIHDHGIVHRDLKPHNILVDAHGEPVIADFGVAHDRKSARLTLTGHLVGTPAYMAPEQVEGLPATPASDLYALGSMLYELVVGETPFAGGDTISTMRAIRERAPPALPRAVPEALAATIQRLLSKRPEERHPSAVALADELEAILARLPADAPSLSGAASPRARDTR